MGKLKASRISNRMAFIRRVDIERILEGKPYHLSCPAFYTKGIRFIFLPDAKRKKGKGNR